jgi:hypothetical protein
MVGMVEDTTNGNGNNDNKNWCVVSVVAGVCKKSVPGRWEKMRLPFGKSWDTAFFGHLWATLRISMGILIFT